MPRIKKEDQPPPTRYEGFERPESNYFKMPNAWIDLTASINNLAELKVVQYILRHTWGYQEYDIKKHITVDEFVGGRKRQDGTRMDPGTGLSERAVRYGLHSAFEHGLIEEAVDARDRGRIRKSYSLRMRPDRPDSPAPRASRQDLPPEVQTLHPDLQSLPSRGANATPRTEKDTKRKTLRERHLHSNDQISQKWSESNRGVQGGDVSSPTAGDPERSARSVPTAVGKILRSRQQPAQNQAARASKTDPDGSETRPTSPKASGRSPKAPPQLAYLVDKFSAEFHDEAHLKSNLSQAARLWKASGLTEAAFCQLFYEAASQTKQRHIQKPAEQGGEWGLRNRIPYMFAVVRNQLGITEAGAAARPVPPRQTPRPDQSPRPPDDPAAYFEGPYGQMIKAQQDRRSGDSS